MRSCTRAAFLLLALALTAPAQAFDDPDTEVARRHFEKGRTAYDAQDYQKALGEFLAAKRAKAAPALDYNIARCYDRLEDYPAAIRHYTLYISGKPGTADQAEVTERIRTLRQRLDEAAETGVRARPPAPRPATPEPELLLRPPSFDESPAEARTTTPPPPTTQVVIVHKDWDEARARRNRNLGIGLGVAAGVVVVTTAVVLGIVLGSSPAPPLTKSSIGPWQATP